MATPCCDTRRSAARHAARRMFRCGAAPFTALIVLSLLFAVPFLWLVRTSLKSTPALQFPPEWIPRPFTWSNYTVRAHLSFRSFCYLSNTLYIALFKVVASLCRARWWPTAGAHPLARPRPALPGADRHADGPHTVTLIPLFLIFRQPGWIGSLNPLTCRLFRQRVFIFLLRQFYLTIPRRAIGSGQDRRRERVPDLLEIIMPLARPVLAAVALFTFIANWNDYLGPLIYLNDKAQYTLAIGHVRLPEQSAHSGGR